MQAAIRNNNQGNQQATFNKLRISFKIVAMLTIIVLSLCVLVEVLLMSATAIVR